jgi:hypothetical protein
LLRDRLDEECVFFGPTGPVGMGDALGRRGVCDAGSALASNEADTASATPTTAIGSTAKGRNLMPEDRNYSESVTAATSHAV